MNEPGMFVPPNSTMPPDVVHPGGGKAQSHLQVHNAYGSLMAQAAPEGLSGLRPDRRPFVISRSGYPGIQPHPLLSTRDNSSPCEPLTLTLTHLHNLRLPSSGC